MASNAANGPSKEANGSYSKVAGPAGSAGQQSKSSFAAKMSDSKKPDDDLSQRRTSQPKAWTTGVNPITQRSNTPQANGAGPRPSPKSFSQNVIHPEKTSFDRQVRALHNGIGSQCNLVTKAGDGFTGVFIGGQKSNEDYNLLLKMVRSASTKAESDQNGAVSEEQAGYGEEQAMVFPLSSLARVDVSERQNARTASVNGASGSFRTDVDISGNLAARERNLQRWEAPAASNLDMSLESSAGGEWDQFKTNEQMFGVKSDYDENIYTTRIDRSHPQHAKRERDAERIAREIEADVSANPHIREERGHRDEGIDEETKYSGVSRNTPADYQPLPSNQPGRYMPPARRQQATNASSEAAIDPAIISSQIARPDSTKAKPEAKTTEKSEQKSELPESKPEAKPEAPRAEQKAQPTTALDKDGKHPKQLGRPGVTENVEHEVLDSFRQFLAVEKIKVQDNKRNRASQDKAVKLNDLKKFSKNFKLMTPVPKDLVPILAKDEGKQRQIVEKAQRIAESTKPLDRATNGLVDPKSQRLLAAARWEGEGGPADASKISKGGSGVSAAQLQKGQVPGGGDFAGTRATSGLSARLQEGHRMHKAGLAAAASIPAPLPINQKSGAGNRASAVPNAMTSPQKSASLRGPPSATSAKFNAAAREFKPNPAASAFKPATMASTTVTSSPTRSGSVTRSISPAGNPPKFFGDRKSFGKWGERPDPISMVKPKNGEENTTTSDGKVAPPLPAQNGGFQWPYRTPPTWVPPPDGENGESDRKYYEDFTEQRVSKDVVPPTQTPPINASAHQHQLPFHLQNGPHPIPQVHTPQQVPHPGPPPQQPHQYSHGHHQYDDHHMRPSASNSSHFPAPSPRMQNPNVAYQSPMPPQAQLYGQPMQYVMHPTPQMGTRQFSNGPQIVPAPGAHLAPVMVQQPSSGGYMPQPMPVPYNQMPIYAGPNGPMYPAPAQPPSGYPSPGRHAPMMVHQGSHQGHSQPIYVPTGQFAQPVYSPQPPGHMPAMRGGFGSPQPHFAQGPYQQHHFPHQPRRTPSTGYAQPHQVHHHMPAQQGVPQMNGVMDMGEDAK